MEGIFSHRFWKRLIDEFDNIGEKRTPRVAAVIAHLMSEIAINDILDRHFSHKAMLGKGFEDKIKFLSDNAVIKPDTFNNFTQLYFIRCEYVHIRNYDVLEPKSEKILSFINKIQYRNSKNKIPDNFDVATKIQNIALYLLLEQLQEDVVEYEEVKELSKQLTNS